MGKLTDLSEEELLKIAESNTEEDTKESDEILDFVLAFNIKDGKTLVKTQLLHAIFQSWSKSYISIKKFSLRLQLYLDGNNKGSFFINQDEIALSKVMINRRKKPKKTTTIPGKRIHFDAFLTFFKLTKGNTWILLDDFYQIYDYWTYKQKTKKHLSKEALMQFCKLFLHVKSDRRKVYIGTNKALLSAVEQYNHEKSEKEKSKKSDPISST